MVKCLICGNKTPLKKCIIKDSQWVRDLVGDEPVELAPGEEIVEYEPETCENERCKQIYRENKKYFDYERVTQAMADDARAFGDGSYYG